MRILLVHNFYQKVGGEDIVFELEKELLSSKKHEVVTYTKHNKDIQQYSQFQKGINTTWNKNEYKAIERQIELVKPDIVHIHNTFPIISPSIYYAITRNHLPIIQTIHNFRFFCANGLFFRDNRTCEDCKNKFFSLPAIKYRCYREDRLASFSVSSMQFVHKQLKTWKNKIDGLIVLSNFSKQKLIDYGFDEKKIYIKPNFLTSDESPTFEKQFYGIYAGRLTSDKGILILLEALQSRLSTIPFIFVGEGEPEIIKKIKNSDPKIKLISFQPRNEVLKLIKNASFLVYPSLLYENNPLAIIEAFAMGTPVIATDNGSVSEMVTHCKTGLLFKLGSAVDLSEKLAWMETHSEEHRIMCKNARLEYESVYSKEKNYIKLINIYEKVINEYR